MAGNAKGKLRALYIMRMLREETDTEHGLSMSDIIRKLADLGMSVDRKTVYTDFKTLREFGLVIETAQRNPVEYYLVQREFTLDELMLMTDAVQSCRFITQTQADRMCRNLRMLAPESQREKLARLIHVDDRVRGRNDAVLANVDTIHEAIRKKCKVTYTYWKAGLDGKAHAQHNGEVYVVSPMRVTFSENRYYLTAWSDKHQQVREYRVDRMRDLQSTNQPAMRCPEMSDYAYVVRDSQFFNRFDGPVTDVTLKVTEDLMPAVLDRFGKEARALPQDDGTANVLVTVRVSPQFFGWVASMNGFVRIIGPKDLKAEYVSYLQKLLEE